MFKTIKMTMICDNDNVILLGVGLESKKLYIMFYYIIL